MRLIEHIPYAQPDDIGTINSFDYTDRIVVLAFMTMSTFTMVLVITEHATEAELAAWSEPVLLGGTMFDVLGWFLGFFLVWPAVRLLPIWLERAAYDAGWRVYSRLRGEV